LVFENSVGCSRSMPMAERWTTRRKPARTQAANSAVGPCRVRRARIRRVQPAADLRN
jgi:hypothetical protein